jgi:3-dehydroquinate dehydratase
MSPFDITPIRDLEEAEDQFQTAMRSHLVNIDVLVNLNDSRLYAIERNFQNELQTLQTDFHEEKNEITLRCRQEMKELVTIIETIEKEEQDRESEVRIMTGQTGHSSMMLHDSCCIEIYLNKTTAIINYIMSPRYFSSGKACFRAAKRGNT